MPHFTARLATVGDVAELVRLRTVMFDSMEIATTVPGWEGPCGAHLREHLGDGRLVGTVVDAPDGTCAPGGGPALAASALAALSFRIPSPTRPPGAHAYLSSVCTDRRWRRHGMARTALSLLLVELRRRGASRVELHATPGGEPLYRSLGFGERPGGLEMRLDL